MGKETINPLVVRGDSGSAWKLVRQYLIAEANGACQDCGEIPNNQSELEIHHIDGCGLNNHRDNLIVLCEDCHRHLKKGVAVDRDNLRYRARLKKFLRKVYIDS